MKKILLTMFMVLLLAGIAQAFTFTVTPETTTAAKGSDVTFSLTTDIPANFSLAGTTFATNTNSTTYKYTVADDNKEAARTDSLAFTAVPSDNSASAISKTATVNVNKSEMVGFEDIQIKVGSKKESDLQKEKNEYVLDREAKPGDKIIVEVDVENRYQDRDLEDVFMTVTVDNLDDGDEFEDETESEDISDDDSETFKIEFTIPDRLDDESYTIDIKVEGDIEDAGSFELTKSFVLNIDKETHDIKITRAEFTQPVLTCNKNTNLNIEVVNLGEEDEEEVKITVVSSDLGLDFTKFDDGDIELSTGTDDDAEYSVSVPVNVIGVEPGTYPVEIKVYRDETRLMDSVTAQLTVDECVNKPTTNTNTNTNNNNNNKDDTEDEDKTTNNQGNTNQQSEDKVDVVVNPGKTTDTQGVTYPAIAVEETSFTSSTAYVVLLGIAAIVLVALIVLIFALLFKKQ